MEGNVHSCKRKVSPIDNGRQIESIIAKQDAVEWAFIFVICFPYSLEAKIVIDNDMWLSSPSLQHASLRVIWKKWFQRVEISSGCCVDVNMMWIKDWKLIYFLFPAWLEKENDG